MERIPKNALHGDEDWGKSLMYLCFDENRLSGLLSRNKGYATAMLRHALNVCREKDRVMLGCYKDNVASAKVILKCGGLLTEECEKYAEGRVSRYFTIEL